MSSSENNIVFSFQGAFGPPTWGHYTSMKLFAIAVLKDYPSSKINMLFMPTAKSGSKPHLAPTQAARTKVLTEFCNLLKKESEFAGKTITFEVSDIEYKLAESKDSMLNSGATIATIDELVKGKSKPDDDKILLGIGFDNMMQLPYWAEVDKYKVRVDKIYVSYRTLSPEELAKTKVYTITQDVSDEKPKLRFETKIPGFLKKVDNVVTGFGLPPETTIDSAGPLLMYEIPDIGGLWTPASLSSSLSLKTFPSSTPGISPTRGTREDSGRLISTPSSIATID